VRFDWKGVAPAFFFFFFFGVDKGQQAEEGRNKRNAEMHGAAHQKFTPLQRCSKVRNLGRHLLTEFNGAPFSSISTVI